MYKLIKKFFEWDGIAPGEGGFVQAALMAAPYVLQTMSALGVFGKKKKHMDSEALRQMYGPRAISKDTQELSNYILNSPYGQQLLASAAEQGQGLQTDMAARAAMSGLSPDTGASSGASDFQVSAAGQAQTGLERGVKAGIMQSAMPIAADLVSGRMAAGLQDQREQNAEPSTLQRIAAAAGQTAAAIPAPGAKPPGAGLPMQALQQAAATPVALPTLRPITPTVPQFQATPQVPVPRRRLSGGQQMTNSRPASMGR